MKKLVVIVLALVAMHVQAQERAPRDGKKMERMHKKMNFSPEQMATIQTKKMTLHLDLTEAQQKEIYAINLANSKTRKAKMDAHKKMKDGAKSKKPSKEMRFEIMNEQLDQQIATKKKMKAVLSADQFEKFEKVQHRKHRSKKSDKQRHRKI